MFSGDCQPRTVTLNFTPSGIRNVSVSLEPEVVMVAGRAKRAHAPVRLTKRVVDALPIIEREYFVLDADLPGFALRVYASGKKCYAVQYRVGRQLRRKSIGLHGMVTAEEARSAARRL